MVEMPRLDLGLLILQTTEERASEWRAEQEEKKAEYRKCNRMSEDAWDEYWSRNRDSWDDVDATYWEHLHIKVEHDLEIVRSYHPIVQYFRRFKVSHSDVFAFALDSWSDWLRREFPEDYREKMEEALSLDWSAAAHKRQYERYETALMVWSHCYAHRDKVNAAMDTLLQFVVDQLRPALSCMPDPGDVPLCTAIARDLMTDAREAVDAIFRVFTDLPTYHVWERGRRNVPVIFPFTWNLRQQLQKNHAEMCATYRQDATRSRPIHMPKDVTDRELIEGYFKNTPLLEFFTAEIPVAWPKTVRQQHTHITANPGAGKTTLVRRLIERDIHSPSKPSVVVIDPSRQFADWVVPIALNAGRKVIHIDPADAWVPSINPFALTMGKRTPGQRERDTIATDAIETMRHILGALSLGMTGLQATLFDAMVQLLFAFPEFGVIENGKLVKRNGTVQDLLDLCMDAAYAQPAISQIGGNLGKLLTDELLDRKAGKGSFHAQRETIKTRLYGIVTRPAIERLVNTQENKIDWYSELNSGTIFVVDTDGLGGDDGTSLFGRMCIATVHRALKLRQTYRIPEEERYETYLYVDEAQLYFSDRSEALMTSIRKLGAGVLFSHHHLKQDGVTDDLRATLIAMPQTRFTYKPKSDGQTLASAMNTTQAYFDSLPKYTFAAYVADITKNAVPFPVEKTEPVQMSDAQRLRFKWDNRQAIGVPPRASAEPSVATQPANEPVHAAPADNDEDER